MRRVLATVSSLYDPLGQWRESLEDLEHKNKNYASSDASTLAVGAVVYLKVIHSEGQCHASFILGKSKIALHTPSLH